MLTSTLGSPKPRCNRYAQDGSSSSAILRTVDSKLRAGNLPMRCSPPAAFKALIMAFLAPMFVDFAEICDSQSSMRLLKGHR